MGSWARIITIAVVVNERPPAKLVDFAFHPLRPTFGPTSENNERHAANKESSRHHRADSFGRWCGRAGPNTAFVERCTLFRPQGRSEPNRRLANALGVPSRPKAGAASREEFRLDPRAD